MYLTPSRLTNGDEVRIIAPSQSMGIVSTDCQRQALQQLEKLGLKVNFGKHCFDMDEFNSSSIEARLDDLHEAFQDKKIKAILTVLGGYNANQLLDKINYELIKENPKLFFGYSDITALQNSFLKKAKLITYSGPHYSTFGCKQGIEWIIEHFRRAIFQNQIGEIIASPTWSDDEWYLHQDNRRFLDNDGYWVISEGEAEGTIVGGNLSTFCLLCGTEYFPDLAGTILFLEDDFESHAGLFNRQLQHINMQPNFAAVRALVIGRFQNASRIVRTQLEQIIRNNNKLKNLPVIANADFGHTMPFFTFPIGGNAKVLANRINPRLFI